MVDTTSGTSKSELQIPLPFSDDVMLHILKTTHLAVEKWKTLKDNPEVYDEISEIFNRLDIDQLKKLMGWEMDVMSKITADEEEKNYITELSKNMEDTEQEIARAEAEGGEVAAKIDELFLEHTREFMLKTSPEDLEIISQSVSYAINALEQKKKVH